MWVFSLVENTERITIVRNPMVAMNDRRDPKEETVFQKAKASG